jgi:hypothetical protein
VSLYGRLLKVALEIRQVGDLGAQGAREHRTDESGYALRPIVECEGDPRCVAQRLEAKGAGCSRLACRDLEDDQGAWLALDNLVISGEAIAARPSDALGEPRLHPQGRIGVPTFVTPSYLDDFFLGAFFGLTYFSREVIHVFQSVRRSSLA